MFTDLVMLSVGSRELWMESEVLAKKGGKIRDSELVIEALILWIGEGQLN